MKKAVIMTGGKQYIVKEGDILSVEMLKATDNSSVSFEPLLVIDGDKVSVGTPLVPAVHVVTEVLEEDARAEKVTAIRYKAKKRVHKLHGHRQHQTKIKVKSIS